MRVHALYFGVLKDHFGESADVGLPESATVADLLVQHQDRANFAWESIAVAVNREYASAGTRLKDGDEVALLPPVSGGCCYETGEILRPAQNDKSIEIESEEYAD
jgi:molybdopterin converting factor small subunit